MKETRYGIFGAGGQHNCKLAEDAASEKIAAESTAILAIAVFLIAANSPYLEWDYGDPELAVAGVLFHAFEWLFVGVPPVVLTAAIVGVFWTRKKE